MRKARLWGLLWMLFIPEIQAAAQLYEEKCTLAEGQTLKVSCPTNTNIYSNSQKAWQRLKNNGEVQTLAITEGSSQVQMGKYFLEDIPSEGMLQIQMTNLQVEDSGLYRCVILGPSDPIILFYPVRLVVTKNSLGTPNSDEYPCQISAQNPTLPPVTTKLRPRPRPRPTPRPVTQLVPTSADRLSSPGFTVTPTNVTHITRAPGISIVIPTACGLLSKTLVFIGLFAVTQRSFAS
ncbi:triggering receptor expressed on myeloid cells 1 [Oryx dammah]|uniref:triggering receptor expressed on myeloid cells 1 n=1 Tax=Oryx dammah TaxID=59534 RepID=UPI001A9BEAA7|nr:triggering receptor expressed on myeloid cells 1 [Oryx dammah]